jgi:serine/threonine-protein kinase
MPATHSSAAAARERHRQPLIVFGPFTFDPNSRLLRRGTEELALPPRVLGVLELLLDRAGDVVPRQELIDTVWKDAFVTDTSLAEAVSVLRQTLGDDPQSPTYVQTLHRRGYRFVAPVSGSDGGSIDRSRSIGERSADTPQAVFPSIGGHLVPWSMAALCAAIAIAAVWQLTRGRQAAAPVPARFEIGPSPGTNFDTRAPAVALSADGSRLAWCACDATGCRLYARELASLNAAPLPGTEDARAPFFSPDGGWIGFFADGRLKKVAVSGGAPIVLGDAPEALGGVWMDRDIIFAGSPTGGLLRVSADGGEAATLTTPRESEGEVRHSWPSVVPNTRVLIFSIDGVPSGTATSLGALSLDAAGNLSNPSPVTWRTLVAGVGIARAAAKDLLVLSRGGELQAIAFDPVRLATSGGPRTVVSHVSGADGRAHFALSANGSLVYATPGAAEHRRALVWWSPAGVREVAEGIPRLAAATLAPDGTRLSGVGAEGTRTDIWVADVGRGASTRLTHAGTNASPVWSADGHTVFFASRTNAAFEIWRRDADGGNTATRVLATTRHSIPLSASPDRTLLAFAQTADRSRGDIWVLPIAGGEPRPLVNGPFDEAAPAFSPDSNLVAYQSTETGRWEIHVQRIRDGRRAVVSTEGGQRPLWSRDGLYYESRGRLLRASVSDAPDDLRIGSTAVIAEIGGASLAGVSAEGALLLDRGADPPPAALVMNLDWIREARARLGPPDSAMPR